MPLRRSVVVEIIVLCFQNLALFIGFLNLLNKSPTDLVLTITVHLEAKWSHFSLLHFLFTLTRTPFATLNPSKNVNEGTAFVKKWYIMCQKVLLLAHIFVNVL